MSELDFGQKMDMRRVFWAMGASTRVDVKLSALSKSDSRSRSGTEEWTDLDVLGVQYVPMAGLVFSVADCKTSKLRATERVFWLRGVSDLFGAPSAYLSRDSELPAAARQLALRLGIAALDARDRSLLMEQAGTSRLPGVGSFLEPDTLRRWDALIAQGPKEMSKLLLYRRSHYWVFQHRRNLLQLPGYIEPHAKALDPKQRSARVLIVDLAWLYLLTVLAVMDEVTRLHLAEFSSSLQQVMVGGEAELRDKQALFKALGSILGEQEMKKAGMAVVPPWFGELVDLAATVARRRSHATQALRILEFTGVETIGNQGASWGEAFPGTDPLDAKVASDVVRFLTRATGLPAGFVELFDRAVTGSRDSKPVAVERNGRQQTTLFEEQSRTPESPSPSPETTKGAGF